MVGTLGIALRWLTAAALLLGIGLSSEAFAQQTPDDAAAREYFERGRSSFEEADYEAALVYFRHAYRLSQRGELQYNIGVAADRLQREDEALEAFEHYLDEAEDPAREAEVQERIAALRQSIAERKATERALAEATIRYQSPMQEDAGDGARVSTSAVIGGSSLAALGAAGVVAMSVGLARDGSCASEVGGRCVTENSATAWTWVYGGIGIAALAGSATWFALSAKRKKKDARATAVSVSPFGVMVRGSF